MFILWVAIYSPFVIYKHDLITLLKLITAPTFILFGLYSHMWFLPSLLFGYLFVSFCHHYNAKILLPVISVISIVTALVSGAYNAPFNPGIPLDYDLARTWLSIPFLYLGFLFYQKGYLRWWVSILLIILGAGLQIIEAKYLYLLYEASAYDHQFLVGTIPFAIGMAALSLNDLKFLQHPLLSKWGNEYSLGIYLIHPATIFIFSPWISPLFTGLTGPAIWQAVSPLVVLIVALAVLILIKRFLPSVFNFLFGMHIEPGSQR
jgi:hypothetical protein